MKKLLIGSLVVLSLVGCQNKDLSLKEQIQLSQDLQKASNEFAESLDGTETYDDIMNKALNYVDDVFESLEKQNLEDDLTKQDVEDYITNYVENNFKYLKEQEEQEKQEKHEQKIQKDLYDAKQELDELQRQYELDQLRLFQEAQQELRNQYD